MMKRYPLMKLRHRRECHFQSAEKEKLCPLAAFGGPVFGLVRRRDLLAEFNVIVGVSNRMHRPCHRDWAITISDNGQNLFEHSQVGHPHPDDGVPLGDQSNALDSSVR